MTTNTPTSKPIDLLGSPLEIWLSRVDLGIDVENRDPVYVTVENGVVAFDTTPLIRDFRTAETGKRYQSKNGRELTFIGEYVVMEGDDEATVKLGLLSRSLFPCTVKECLDTEHLIDPLDEGNARHIAFLWSDDNSGEVEVNRSDADILWRVETYIWDRGQGDYAASALRTLADKIEDAETVARKLNGRNA